MQWYVGSPQWHLGLAHSHKAPWTGKCQEMSGTKSCTRTQTAVASDTIDGEIHARNSAGTFQCTDWRIQFVHWSGDGMLWWTIVLCPMLQTVPSTSRWQRSCHSQRQSTWEHHGVWPLNPEKLGDGRRCKRMLQRNQVCIFCQAIDHHWYVANVSIIFYASCLF
jgi:hypothetical protein